MIAAISDISLGLALARLGTGSNLWHQIPSPHDRDIISTEWPGQERNIFLTRVDSTPAYNEP